MTDLTLAEARERLKNEARTYGYSRQVNPYVTLLEEVKWRAGHVAWIRDLIGRLPQDELWTIDHNGNRIDGVELRRYDKERDRLDRVCKLAIDAGVAERYVQLAELQGQALFAVLQTAFDDPLVALTPEQRQQLGPALRRALAASEQVLEVQAAEAVEA